MAYLEQELPSFFFLQFAQREKTRKKYYQRATYKDKSSTFFKEVPHSSFKKLDVSTPSLLRGLLTMSLCRYRFSWKPISTYMSLTLARLCGEWQLVRTHNFQDLKIMLLESRWRNWKAVEEGFSEIGKPLKKSESRWRRFSWISRKSESRWRKSNFEQGKLEFRRRKIPILPRYSWVSGNFGVSCLHQICYYVCTWIYLIGFSVFQLLITLAFDTKMK